MNCSKCLRKKSLECLLYDPYIGQVFGEDWLLQKRELCEGVME